ncbi:cytochrome C assembly family protein [Simiduia agarivorans]|uniref:Cytochrome C assembly protein n=1 Tax=Simiduia agarivorans (strain DSM 21679 / JCM 13881 / BCRC 17597 / SA1) TaxID=1117647 RepID=K4KIV7_SIMAS|nr:cytochrome c biogenesis protein CcsA [Simiduia agarivorans]AFU97908.1 cytochrome C assembly protein [Simiduia agarivorans SA1 = DSM 21679]
MLIYTLAANLAAIVLYLAATGFGVRQFSNKRPVGGRTFYSLTLTAVVFHWSGLLPLLFSTNGINLSFFATGSLVAAVMNALVLISSFRKPVHTLLLILMPLSIVCVSLLLGSHHPDHFTPLTEGLALHVILSLLAYSLLTIATAQAVLLAYQTHQLKNHQPGGLIKALPPLQSMESLLFELLWLGFILLTTALATGWFFVQDLLAQHLAHKTVFSVAAWLIYGCLLWGRHYLGWRGYTAVRFALGGFAALMLAFFGSKFVLELVLGIQ